jgi:hypothetical protein
MVDPLNTSCFLNPAMPKHDAVANFSSPFSYV